MLPESSKSALGSMVEGAVPNIPGGTEPECFNHSKARVKAGSRHQAFYPPVLSSWGRRSVAGGHFGQSS